MGTWHGGGGVEQAACERGEDPFLGCLEWFAGFFSSN